MQDVSQAWDEARAQKHALTSSESSEVMSENVVGLKSLMAAHPATDLTEAVRQLRHPVSVSGLGEWVGFREVLVRVAEDWAKI